MLERYVPTHAIQAAVKGRETEVIEALRIPWQDGAPHIHCPYPDHDDENPSWRWDARKRRAHCTCIGPHSIFEVMMHVERLEFDPAKLRVAEILKLDDLIRTPGRQAMDAASLLRPPADQRDEDLAHSYLAYRLDVRPDQVPMPSTPIVGWRSLAYYDPPAKRGGQPKLVGHQPCVVFGTRSPDGRRHGHRIYVQPEGRREGRAWSKDRRSSTRCEEGGYAEGGAQRRRVRRPLGRSGKGATLYPRRRY